MPRAGDGGGGGTPLLLDGRPVPWSALRARLAEAAGTGVIEEIALDRALEEEARRRGIEVGEAETAAAEARLAEALSEDAGASGAATPALVERLRRSRGLGPVRYAALLRRNALLHALTADRATVEAAELRLAHAVRHGRRHRIRVIVAPTERGASLMRRDLAAVAAGPARSAAFAELAVERSTDASAAAGGLIRSMSASDPAYEDAVRRAVAGLAPASGTGGGGLSRVIGVERGFALILHERVIPEDGVSLEAAGPGLERELARRKRRVAAERLARDLIGRAGITPLDRSLAWSWEGSATAE